MASCYCCFVTISLICSFFLFLFRRVRDEIDKEFACQSELSKRRETATATIQDYTSAKKEMEAQITYAILV